MRRLLVDGRNGTLYGPRDWAKDYGTEALAHGVQEPEVVVLLQGPSHPDYWEAWEMVLRDYNRDGTRLVERDSGIVFEVPLDDEWN